jgi:hypothetical protein
MDSIPKSMFVHNSPFERLKEINEYKENIKKY